MKSSADYFEREDCRMCLSKDLSLAVTLTASPPGNNFIKNDESEIEEQEFPLQSVSYTHLTLPTIYSV